jgi:hypothetical protein
MSSLPRIAGRQPPCATGCYDMIAEGEQCGDGAGAVISGTGADRNTPKDHETGPGPGPVTDQTGLEPAHPIAMSNAASRMGALMLGSGTVDALGPGAPAEAMLEAIASLGWGRRAGRHRRDDGTPRARSVLDDVLAAQRARQPVVLHRGSPGHGRRVSAGPLGSRTPPSRCPRSTKPSTPSPNGTGASPTSFACRENRADGLPAVKIRFPTAPRRCHEHSHASSA